MDLGVTASGGLTGVLVGLTGMGGGALTMPLLTLVFGVPPLAAVSTDLVANAVMKPVGAAVHLRRRTVDLRLVGLLCIGSLPCAALGSALARFLGSGEVHTMLQIVTGLAVLLAATMLFLRMHLDSRRDAELGPMTAHARPGRTIVLGAVAGLVVGTTSVGSGSIVVVCLLMLNRRLSSAQLVGTDLVQAVPLVLVAAGGHLLVGEADFGLVASLLAGSIPGVLAGSLLSSRVPDRPVRVLLGVMLAVTGLVLVGVDVALAAVIGLAAGVVVLAAVRSRTPMRIGGDASLEVGSEGGRR